MQEIIIYDANGDSLINLVQWDKDVCIYIKDSYIDDAYYVHFFNDKMNESLVVESTFADGILKAKIPNILLTQPYAITGYINVEKNDEQKCIYKFRIGVRKKPKPSSYIYTESDDYITLESVLEECMAYAADAKQSSDESRASEINAENYKESAETYASNARNSQTAAENSASIASQKATSASNNANLAKSYAVGSTGTRLGEDTDNSKYYYNEASKLLQSLNGAIVPMGTIFFEDLASATKKTGYMYNISNSFTSDSRFKDGGGHQYTTGTNVYCTADGYWDCLVGTMVTGIKGNSESTYRQGNVNITKDNVGLGNVPNVSTNNQTPTFSESSVRNNISSGETLSAILGKIEKYFTDLKTVAFTGVYSDLTETPQIVNNLITDSSGSVLDASQGKALNDKYTAINNLIADEVSESDVDSIFSQST